MDEKTPRVLTLDEVKRFNHRDEIWIEYNGSHSKLFMLTVSRRRWWGFTFFRHLPLWWTNYGHPADNCDWYWRAWSAQPTKEQREAAAWEAT